MNQLKLQNFLAQIQATIEHVKNRRNHNEKAAEGIKNERSLREQAGRDLEVRCE